MWPNRDHFFAKVFSPAKGGTNLGRVPHLVYNLPELFGLTGTVRDGRNQLDLPFPLLIN